MNDIPNPASLRACWKSIPKHEAAEIQQAAFLMHRGHQEEAEQHRVAAGYGGLDR